MSRTLTRLKEEVEALGGVNTSSLAYRRMRSRPIRGVRTDIFPPRGGSFERYDEPVSRFKHNPPRRCRPRLPALPVRAWDKGTGNSMTVDVAHLQDSRDPLAALRECVNIMFRSSTDLYKRLDVDGSGSVTSQDLEARLRMLGVPWQQVTGLTRAELLQLLGKGRINIIEFLGKPCLSPRPHWSQMSLREQWEDYCCRIVDLDLINTSCSPPLWEKLVAEELPPKQLEDVPIFREDLELIQGKIVRIEKFLSDFVENKRELVKLRLELSSVTESEERVAEMKRKREEEEREKQRKKRAAGIALVTTEGNSKISIFGKKGSRSLLGEPSKDDLVNAFAGIVADDELVMRNMYKELGLPLILGDKVRSAIDLNQLHGNVSQEEFGRIIKQLTSAPSVPSTAVSDWVTLAQGRPVIPVREIFAFCARTDTGILSMIM
jgi:hypothetical protein